MVASLPEKNMHFLKIKKLLCILKGLVKFNSRQIKNMKVFITAVFPLKVKQNLVLEANCSEEGRLEDIFNSLKKAI